MNNSLHLNTSKLNRNLTIDLDYNPSLDEVEFILWIHRRSSSSFSSIQFNQFNSLTSLQISLLSEFEWKMRLDMLGVKLVSFLWPPQPGGRKHFLESQSGEMTIKLFASLINNNSTTWVYKYTSLTTMMRQRPTKRLFCVGWRLMCSDFMLNSLQSARDETQNF